MLVSVNISYNMTYNNKRLRDALSQQSSECFFPFTILPTKKFKKELSSKIDVEGYLEKVDELIDSLWKGNCKKDSMIDVNANRKKFSKKGFDFPEATHKLDCSDEEFEYWSKDITENDRFVYRIHILTDTVELVNCVSHFEYKDIKKLESKTFSEERLSEREQWVQEHSKMSKTSQRLLMPLHLRYPDVKDFSEEFKDALKTATQTRLKYITKQKLPTVEPLTTKLLYDKEIRGTLIKRKKDNSWTVF